MKKAITTRGGERSKGGRGKKQRREESPPPPPPLEPAELNKFMKKTIQPGMYVDEKELEGTNAIVGLNFHGWLNLAKFNCIWYPELVREFYMYMQVDANDSVIWYVHGKKGILDYHMIAQEFGIEDYNDHFSEWPPRNWSLNCPFTPDEAISYFNNDRMCDDDKKAWRHTMTGQQKLAFKIVKDILMPAKSNDQSLSVIHTLVTYALLNEKKINLPRLIIKNMDRSRGKSFLPYGMLISNFLVNDGVNVNNEMPEFVSSTQKIGEQSLTNQEIYWWQDEVWSKWEVYELYEPVMKEIWEQNGCSAPQPPQGWTPNPPGEIRAPRIRGPSVATSSSRPMRDHDSSPMSDHEMLLDMYKGWKNMQLGMRRIEDRLDSVDRRVTGIENVIYEVYPGYPRQPDLSHPHPQDMIDEDEE